MADDDRSSIEMIRENNRLDLELYEFAKKLFDESLGKNEKVIREGLVTLRALPKPGSVQNFCNSSLSAGRFLMSKIASVI